MRQHQADVAALAQWTPLICKMAFKAAQRAAKIGSFLRQDDFQQELSITLLRAIDAYDPDNEAGAKLITFLHTAFHYEINKLLNKDDRNLNGKDPSAYKVIQSVLQSKHNGIDRSYIDANSLDAEYLADLLEDGIISEDEHKRIRSALNKQVTRTISGDHIAEGDDGGSVDVWGYLEDDSERSAENLVMDAELIQFVRETVSANACAAFDIYNSNSPFVAHQLQAYNEGVMLEYEETGYRRVTLDLNFRFVCRLLGFGDNKIKKIMDEVKEAIAQYGKQ